MSKLVIKYVWEIPVRATHWINVAAITLLCATGLFIGHPFSLAASTSQYIMGWVRFVHFTCAYVFTICLVVRAYWAFAGNKYANWRTFVPYITHDGREKMWGTFRYYVFLSRKLPHMVGHNTMANAAYLSIFLLYFVMIVTGFALYSEYAPGGLYSSLFGWITQLFSNQALRFVHHGVMWLLIGFVIQHVYSSWLMDIKERGGVMSGMFSGYKSVEED
jgi:Ni/Fe-hydrogenase 1 B-type cytochrome subunit